eukprot:m.40278 g.40278  ORF g.40278 m.40278 type:complete len:848 (+) comp10297_c0_seq2:245-2788(+)
MVLPLSPIHVEMLKQLTGNEDNLLILARGLGLSRLLVAALHSHCSSRALVLVINATPSDRDLFVSMLTHLEPDCSPQVIDADTPSADRIALYMKGGVVFVTSRILVVDLLTKTVPVELISGFFVLNAHRVLATTTEAFILRLFRHGNKTGFIRAVTDYPEGLTSEFAILEKVLKNLWLRHVQIWPRFERSVLDTLATCAPEVSEIRIPLTDKLLRIQQAIADIMEQCIKDLKKSRPSLDTSRLTLDRGLFSSFESLLQQQLGPVWNTLSPTTRQIVNDLKQLRVLAEALFQHDCVSFYHQLLAFRAARASRWLLYDRADDLFVTARQRVYRPVEEGSDASLALVLEPHPKWMALRTLLSDLARENPDERVLVLVRDTNTADQLQAVLTQEPDTLLRCQLARLEKYRKDVARMQSSGVLPDEPQKATRSKEPSKYSRQGKRKRIEQALMDLRDKPRDLLNVFMETDAPVSAPGPQDIVQDFDNHYGVQPRGGALLHALSSGEAGMGPALAAVLQQTMPTIVVFYDPHIVATREVEVFISANTSHYSAPPRVFFMLYEASLQEQKYLSALRNEKQAFEGLIASKAHMAVSTDQDGRSGHRQELELMQYEQPQATHLAAAATRPKVVIDVREFRSALPCLLHEHGADITPITLSIGDYVLSPDICVERKSIPDLIGSLNSGRLYNQCVSMTRYYKFPALLIEFSESRPFSLLGSGDSLSDDIEFRNISSKLVLLTLTFPDLKIFWSRSPHATAEMFLRLKRGLAPPDAAAAAALTDDSEDVVQDERYSAGPKAFLSKLPGVTSRNIRPLMEGIGSLRQLFRTPLERLEELMGKTAAKNLFDFIAHATASG